MQNENVEQAQTHRDLQQDTSSSNYLTFNLGQEIYALEILKVQEIIQMMEVTSVPRMPAHVRGVVNLRGRVIPVIDLRRKFGMPSQQDTQKTCIIVVQVSSSEQNQEVTIGIVVDEVYEVVGIPSEKIEPPPRFGSEVNTDFIIGMGQVREKLAIILDIDQVISNREAVESICENDTSQQQTPLAAVGEHDDQQQEGEHDGGTESETEQTQSEPVLQN